ncbi:MAG: DMT family transporter [Coriobacteriales bacterium]|jgi:drug/metabolite transporter (DMT)-like permease|nr:DMT family transporter [Coriobacteriales bacterium]
MRHPSLRFKEVASVGVLLIVAMIWGLCFVAQRAAMEYIGPFLFNGIRCILAVLFVLLVLLVMWLARRWRPVSITPTNEASPRNPAPLRLRSVLFAGLICGVVLYLGSNMQQIGLVYVTASKSAFITTLYIVMVPVIGIFLKHKTRWNTWVSVGIAVIGLYLLCISTTLSLQGGDTILIVCALFWALQILVVGHFAPRLSLMQLFGMCTVQFLVSGVLSLLSAPLFDGFFVNTPLTTEAVFTVAPELLYAGLLSTGVSFTLAAIAQRYTKPTPAALVMSTESVFGLLGGVLLLGEVLTFRESFGCGLLLVAVILTQLDFTKPSIC